MQSDFLVLPFLQESITAAVHIQYLHIDIIYANSIIFMDAMIISMPYTEVHNFQAEAHKFEW